MARPRLLTLVVLGIAVASILAEAQSTRIHVTVKVVQQTFTGDLANPKLGDQLITSVELPTRPTRTWALARGLVRSSASHNLLK